VELLERGSTLDTLAGGLPAGDSARGRLMVVEGAAGSGKSTLLAALARRAANARVRVLAARGGELERAFPFGTIRRLFEKTLADFGEAERDRLLSGAAAPAGAVVAKDPVDAAAAPGFPVLHAIYWLVSNLAAVAPLLLSVDDLHWVDDSSLLALAYVGRRIADLPASLAVAMRPHEPGAPVELIDQLTSDPEAVTVSLPPLGAPSVASIVRDAVPHADPALCEACHDVTGGNPFYLRELLRTLTGDGASALDPEAVRRAAVPEVGERVMRRIARLGADAERIARSMAVLGDGGRLADAAALAQVDEPPAAAAARAMARIEVLAEEDPFEFVHPLVRRSVYDSLTVTERDEAHLAAGRLMRDRGGSSELVAAHFAKIRPHGSTEISLAMEAAAEAAVIRGAPRPAVDALRRALAEGAPEPARVDLLHRLGQLLALDQDLAAEDSLVEARRLTSDVRRRAEIAMELSALYAYGGKWAGAVQVIGDAIDELGEADPDLSLQMEALRAVILMHDCELAPLFRRDWDRLRALAEAPPWGARALAALLACSAAARGDATEDAEELADLALRDLQLIRPPDGGGWASSQLIGTLVMLEARERAEVVMERVAATARESGSYMSVLVVQCFEAWLAVRSGDLAAGEAAIAPVFEAAIQRQMAMDLTSAVYFVSDALVERRELEYVVDFLESTELDPSFMATGSGGMMLYARGRVRAARGDRGRAVEDLRFAGEVFSKLGFGPTHNAWRSELALSLPAQEREKARALAAEGVEMASATGLARPHGIAVRAAGMLAEGDRGVAMLRDSVELLAAVPARLEHARSLVELGAALRRQGQRSKAREALADGLDLAGECGADRTVARAREELSAAGARPRRVARKGVEALTPSERRVAQLIAEGRSNAEAAQELFVSLKTVETHLTRAYAKLGLSGGGARSRLAAALGRRA
jgi:DNA-binding CsgD family transcriptional regulator